MTHFHIVSVLPHYKATYDTHSCLLFYHNFHVFFWIHCKWLTFKSDESFIVARFDDWIPTYILSTNGILLIITAKVMNPYFSLMNPFLSFSGVFFWKKLAIFWYPYFLFIRFLVKSFSLYISDKTTSWVTPSYSTVSWEKVDSISFSEHPFFVFLQTFLLISSISVFHYALNSQIFCVIFHPVFEFLILVIFWMPWMMNTIR